MLLIIYKLLIRLDLVYCWKALGWRLGLGQVVMPFIDWALHMIQW